jgi:hypothetical protein
MSEVKEGRLEKMSNEALLDEYVTTGSFVYSSAQIRRGAEIREEILRRMTAQGGACWRMGCRRPVPEGKVGCDEHRLVIEDE